MFGETRMKLCGKCLHDRQAHSEINASMVYCAICMKFCDLDEFQIEHKPSGIICQDGIQLKLK